MASPRSGITPRVRWQVFARDGFRCRYCGKQGGDAVLVVDHVQPVARGGSDRLSNLVTACEECNQGKTDNVIPSHDVLTAVYRTANIAALWLQWEWDALVQTDHPDKTPSRSSFMAVIGNSRSYAHAYDILKRVAQKYHEGYFGNWAWPGFDEPGYDVNAVLQNYSEWMDNWETDETYEQRDARFWEGVPL